MRIWGNSALKDVMLRPPSHFRLKKRGPVLLVLFGRVVQNVDSVSCIHVKRHQSAWRWIIFGGICTFCNMLISKAAKARLPGERRGDGERRGKKKEGESRVEKRETDGGWCKLWMQRAISKRKRKAERNLKSCISDYAFTTFSYHGPWANLCAIWPLCAYVHARLFETGSIRVSERALTYSSMSSCVELSCAVRHS